MERSWFLGFIYGPILKWDHTTAGVGRLERERICISRVWGLVFPKLRRLVRVAIISVVFEGSTGTSTLVKLPN